MLVLLGTTQWAQDLNRYFTKENIQMYTKHKKRHPQCDWLPGKCNWRPKSDPIPCAWKWLQLKRPTPLAMRRIWKQTLRPCWWKCKMVQPLWKHSMVASYKVKHVHHLINKSTPGYSPQNKFIQYIHTQTGMWMFTTLVTIAPNWKQLQCPVFWMDEQIIVCPYL